MMYRINYSFVGTGRKLRSGALMIDAADQKAALTEAKKQLDAELDWYKIVSTVGYGAPKKD